MGNSASHANYDRHRRRDHDGADGPDSLSPHRPPPMRKQKSLDLPDLASLALYSAPSKGQPPRSAAIAIPNSDMPTERPVNKLMSTDLLETTVVHPMKRPDYMRRPSQSRYAQAVEEREERQRSAQSSRASSPHGARAHAPPPPAVKLPTMTPLPRAEPIVHSTIPVGLEAKAQLPTIASEPSSIGAPDELVLEPTTITWRGGGRTVLLARAGDDNWQGRTAMDQDPDAPEVFRTTIPLTPGTHHIRFLVDDQWRVADDLPTTVDDQGSLANYVDVGLTTPPEAPIVSALPTPLPLPRTNVPLKRHENGYSFWSTAGSSADYEGTDNPYEIALEDGEARLRSKSKWTSEIPEELIRAAQEEEVYLQSQAHINSTQNGRIVVDGFIPAPSIPPAPGLPRHLDKLILNYRAVNAYHTPSGSPVLPVPSHVVIHHLSTSAIKNGVLAVATTTRYQKKYLTTVYYKPT
ncbi:5'-AMP-activated protein kinase beta subunit, interation domain-containing protein [Schizophyllum fasciatum]